MQCKQDTIKRDMSRRAPRPVSTRETKVDKRTAKGKIVKQNKKTQPRK